MNEELPPEPHNKITRLLLGFLLVILLITLIIGAKYFNVQELLENVLVQVKNLGSWGAIIFITIYILATVLFLPGSILTLGGGVIFGVVFGSIYVFIAATLGATAAFLVGRYLARGWVNKQIEGNAKFAAIDRAVAKEGFKIVVLTRLSPIFPFNILNYAFGITQVTLKDYALGSIGMLPGTIMYVYIGSLAGDIATVSAAGQNLNSQAEMAKWVIRILGFIATVAVTIYITRIARKALEENI